MAISVPLGRELSKSQKKEPKEPREILISKGTIVEISASPKDFEQIAYYLHRMAAKEPLHKKSELKAARRLGNLIAVRVSAQRNKWLDERHRWDPEALEIFIFKEEKTPEEIAKIEGVPVEKVEKVLRRFGLLRAKRKLGRF